MTLQVNHRGRLSGSRVMEKLEINILASNIAQQVSSEVSIYVALIGMVGLILGAIITVLGYLIRDYFARKPKNKLDSQRKALLENMLKNKNFEWRNINTLSKVIGSDIEETKRLLISIDARSSQKESEKDMWALIKDQPLPEDQA